MPDYSEYVNPFKTDGYVRVPGFLTETECQEAETHIQSYIETIAPTLPKTDVMYEDYDRPETLIRISQLQLDPFFDSLRSQSKTQ